MLYNVCSRDCAPWLANIMASLDAAGLAVGFTASGVGDWYHGDGSPDLFRYPCPGGIPPPDAVLLLSSLISGTLLPHDAGAVADHVIGSAVPDVSAAGSGHVDSVVSLRGNGACAGETRERRAVRH